MTQFILLTHTREVSKSTGTGKLVKQALQEQCEVIIWSRTQPDPRLTEQLIAKETLLLYPKAAFQTKIKTDVAWPQTDYKTIVLLDGTWQETQKMYNHSPYLHDLTSHTLQVNYRSNYRLRRRQKSHGLCTAEVVLEILKRQKQKTKFDVLNQYFELHNSSTGC